MQVKIINCNWGKEEKGEKTDNHFVQTYSTTSGIQTDNSLFQRKKPIVPVGNKLLLYNIIYYLIFLFQKI